MVGRRRPRVDRLYDHVGRTARHRNNVVGCCQTREALLRLVWEVGLWSFGRAHGQPASVPRDEVSQATAYKRSTRDRYLRFMLAKDVVELTGKEVKAAEELF